MRRLIFLVCVLASVRLFSQVPAAQPDVKNLSLPERYWLMKTSAQTFKEYKVIKEVVLDREWKVAEDSLKADRARLGEAKSEIARLEGELQSARATLKINDQTIAENEHDATHINFMGMEFHKAVFTGIAVTVTGALLFFVILLVSRLRIMHYDIKEKTEGAEAIRVELEDYKRKSLEKQIKLSRELQTERNRLQELRSA